MRLVRGPGGQMVDARRISGWITAPDGSRAVCPRCEGTAFIRLGEVRDALILPAQGCTAAIPLACVHHWSQLY